MIWMLGLGASAGACVRYFLTNLIKKHVKGSFPLATFFLNVSGALVLGFVVGIRLKTLSYAILGTGFLGGYTTFSTFNYGIVCITGWIITTGWRCYTEY